jgi:hypothetical protein
MRWNLFAISARSLLGASSGEVSTASILRFFGVVDEDGDVVVLSETTAVFSSA